MRAQYFFDGVDICTFGAGVSKLTGAYSALQRKEIEKVEYANQHGYRVDRSAIRYQNRTIEMMFYFLGCDRQCIRESVRRMINLVDVNRPVRLMRIEGYKVDVWDVDLVAENSADFLRSAATLRFTFHEPAPVKAVYRHSGAIASFEINTPNSLEISWGDKSFEKAKSGIISHEYTDERSPHYIIVSGVISESTITISAINNNMQELCRILR